jgi:glucose-6-phosphate dehydrogenase assembly protein OpcA
VATNLSARTIAHSVPEIERALALIWADTRARRDDSDRHVIARSSVLNLVVLAGRAETAERCSATIAATAGRHPSRSLVISMTDPDGPAGLDVRIDALSTGSAGAGGGPGGTAIAGAETIHIAAHGETGGHLASLIVPLLRHDLPVALWWPSDPMLRSHRADRLLPLADLLIVDGSSWSGDGLDRLADLAHVAHTKSLKVSDFSLLRQARWREALASVYDPPDLQPHLRGVRSIAVEFAVPQEQDPNALTNIVRPVYHVAWLASRLGMTVVEPMKRLSDGRRVASLRQGDHPVAVEWRPVCSDLGDGSTVRVEIASRLRAAALLGTVEAGDHTVEVTIYDQGRERVRRTYLAPRLNDVDLLERAVEDSAADPVAVEALEMAGHLIGADTTGATAERRRSDEDD